MKDGTYNAKIRWTSLRQDVDHDMFQLLVSVVHQFGKQEYVVNNPTMSDIMSIVTICDERDWESVPGHYVRVVIENGFIRCLLPILGE